MDKNYKNEDLLTLMHTGDEYNKYCNAVVPPIFMNSLHAFDTIEEYNSVDVYADDGFVYARDGNPTVHILERKIAELEHGSRAVVFSSGMAAFSSAVMATCKAGSHIICLRNTYEPVTRMYRKILKPQFHMEITYVSGDDLQEIEDAVQDNTDLMILESPGTFVFNVVDLKAIAEIAHKHGFKTYMDNSCLTPVFQKPLDLGIDIVMHTMSKFMGGHSDIVGGVLVSKDEELMRRIMSPVREYFGGILGPMEAWLVIRGLRTLDLRARASMETGVRVAAYLEKHPKVRKVNHTSLASHPQAEIIARQQTGHTGLLSLELDTDSMEDVFKFVNNLKLFAKGCSWGGHESLAIVPLYDEPDDIVEIRRADRKLVRLYCGLEGADNLIADLEQALSKL